MNFGELGNNKTPSQLKTLTPLLKQNHHLLLFGASVNHRSFSAAAILGFDNIGMASFPFYFLQFSVLYRFFCWIFLSILSVFINPISFYFDLGTVDFSWYNVGKWWNIVGGFLLVLFSCRFSLFPLCYCIWKSCYHFQCWFSSVIYDLCIEMGFKLAVFRLRGFNQYNILIVRSSSIIWAIN